VDITRFTVYGVSQQARQQQIRRRLHPVPDTDPQPTVAAAIGRRLRRMREEGDHVRRQDDVARLVADRGLDWTRDTVASVENGRRGISLDEFVVLCAAFDVAPHEWFSPEGALTDYMRLPSSYVVSVEDVRRVMRGDFGSDVGDHPIPPRYERKKDSSIKDKIQTAVEHTRELAQWWPESPHRPTNNSSSLDEVFRGAGLTAEQKAAQKLGITPFQVAFVAYSLWGTTLSARRDDLTAKRATADADKRSLQATRGHVSRALIAEIQQAIDEHGVPGAETQRTFEVKEDEA
jgi:hypothetical protein